MVHSHFCFYGLIIYMYGSVLTAKTSNKFSFFKAKFSPGAIVAQFSVDVTVKLTKSGTLEIFQLFLLRWDQSRQRVRHASKPQNHKLIHILACGLVLSRFCHGCNTINGFVSFVSLTVMWTHPFLTVSHKIFQNVSVAIQSYSDLV